MSSLFLHSLLIYSTPTNRHSKNAHLSFSFLICRFERNPAFKLRDEGQIPPEEFVPLHKLRTISLRATGPVPNPVRGLALRRPRVARKLEVLRRIPISGILTYKRMGVGGNWLSFYNNDILLRGTEGRGFKTV